MDARFGRWWRRRPAEDQAASESARTEPTDAAAVPVPIELLMTTPVNQTAGSEAEVEPDIAHGPGVTAEPSLPEQPVLVPASTAQAPARVGEVLPATRSGALLKHLPLPRVPKRTVFAVGICAGLAAPVVGRQLATQALLALLGQKGATRPLEGATVEIIRIHYAGAAAGHAASAVTKILEQVRK